MNFGQLPDVAWCFVVGDGVVDQGSGIVLYLDPKTAAIVGDSPSFMRTKNSDFMVSAELGHQKRILFSTFINPRFVQCKIRTNSHTTHHHHK